MQLSYWKSAALGVLIPSFLAVVLHTYSEAQNSKPACTQNNSESAHIINCTKNQNLRPTFE